MWHPRWHAVLSIGEGPQCRPFSCIKVHYNISFHFSTIGGSFLQGGAGYHGCKWILRGGTSYHGWKWIPLGARVFAFWSSCIIFHFLSHSLTMWGALCVFVSATLCMLYAFSLVMIFECYNSSWGSSNVGASLAHSRFSLCVDYISLNIAFQAFAFFLLKGLFVDNFLTNGRSFVVLTFQNLLLTF
jgi:hypothetical protein